MGKSLRSFLSFAGLLAPSNQEGRDFRIYARQVHMLFEGSKVSPVSNVFLGLVFVWALVPYVSWTTLTVWLACLSLASIYRQYLSMRYFDAADKMESSEKWCLGFLLGCLGTALCWTFTCLVFFPSGQPIAQFLIAFVLSGVTAGGLATLSAVRGVALCFLLPILITLIFRCGVEGTRLSITMGLLAIAYLAFSIRSTKIVSSVVFESLLLSAEKDVLLEEISQKKIEVDRANIQLQEALVAANSSNQAKTNFLANMSHEIRTPMNAILGMTDLAIEEAENPRVIEDLVVVKNSAKRLLEVINDILDISKIEAGQLDIHAQEINLIDELKRIFPIFRNQMESGGIEFHEVYSSDLPESVVVDPVRLGQVITNLVGNAVKFTPEGGEIEFRIDLVQKHENSVELDFSVQDTGIGIEQHELENIFRPFSQADDSLTRRHQGTGLGLAICSQLVSLMGGEISVKSEVGKGSTFSFCISLPAKYQKVEASQESSYEEPEVLQILLVEDNKVNAKLAGRLLERAGHSVVTVGDGQQAVDMVMSGDQKFDLVLMDCQMPILDGYKATRMIREERHELNLPIIALTAHAMAGDKERCLAVGMDGYVTKPIEKNELFSEIERVIKNSSKPS